jgi:hypothetical protein
VSVVSTGERLRVEEHLRRIDDLVAALGHIADPAARESARELVEAVLDLHGLALARIMAIAAGAEGGALLDRLAQDEQIKAVLLLYGLHPEDPATRIRRALDGLGSRFAAARVTAELARVSGSAASVRVCGGTDGAEDLRREIEEAVANAAPDLDEIVVEWLEVPDAMPAAAVAG